MFRVRLVCVARASRRERRAKKITADNTRRGGDPSRETFRFNYFTAVVPNTYDNNNTNDNINRTPRFPGVRSEIVYFCDVHNAHIRTDRYNIRIMYILLPRNNYSTNHRRHVLGIMYTKIIMGCWAPV